MGQLPSERVTQSRVFSIIGIDFCGPFNLSYKLRSKGTIKVYICVFICFATKAVHLEIVEDLTTQAFIASFIRFTSRRGRCSHVYSDNATNFVGSKTELQNLQKLFNSECNKNSFSKFCADENIEWHMIPPRSPHFGGLWEAAVKSANYHLKRIIGQYSYTMEQLSTLVTQVEACLNSRPLTPMSNDPSNLTALTPAHFIIGSSITTLPNPNLSHLVFNKLSQYQRVQYMMQQFWKRWSLEYLSELQHRYKWQNGKHDFKVGSLVILKEDNLPPCKWLMGRIVDIHPGADGVIRVVTVKTETSIFKRSITKVSLLPIEVDSSETN